VSKQDKASLTCPQCGHQQLVSPAAFSAVCKKCSQYLRVQDLLKPTPKVTGPAPQQKQIACFDCGAEFEVPAGAQSTMCKKCSSYIDLHDYNISTAVSKNFKTKGTFIVQPAGYVFNTEAVVGDAVIKGRFLGKLIAERSLTLYSTAEIKGSLAATRLIVPAGNHVRWNGEIKVEVAEIDGELVANVNALKSILVNSHGRLFGTVTTRSLVAETGAVLVGDARIGVTRI
jgi:cytoskeletal protein CcmA (bactofilin family)/ribosomal protein S27E